jgi:hypothetical protein
MTGSQGGTVCRVTVQVSIVAPGESDSGFHHEVRSVNYVRADGAVGDIAVTCVTNQNPGAVDSLGHVPFQVSTRV